MAECIFCKIVNGELDSAKVWEDSDFLAVLDLMPNTKGMTLILTKKHYDSYAFDMPDLVYKKFMIAAKKVSKILERGLSVKRVALVMEGLGINHAHLKLYPLHGLDTKFKEMWANEKKFYDNYEGYISTHTGPQVEMNILKNLAKEIQN
jgi:diadenosine tetraphosphate (Ap4A) HIT family hydrolase